MRAANTRPSSGRSSPSQEIQLPLSEARNDSQSDLLAVKEASEPARAHKQGFEADADVAGNRGEEGSRANHLTILEDFIGIITGLCKIGGGDLWRMQVGR